MKPNRRQGSPRHHAGPASRTSAPAAPAAAEREGGGTVLLALGLVLVAFNLRTPITSVGPVLPEVMRSTGLSMVGASMLTTLPPLCFGLIGPLAPMLAQRLGTERAVLAVLVVLALGTSLRGYAHTPALFVGQILACLSIGTINVLLPGLVKRDFPHRTAVMTGLYTMALTAGAATAAGSTVPLAGMLGASWAGALAFWAMPAVIAAALWLPHLPSRRNGGGPSTFRVRGLWTDALAWQVTLFMGLQSALAYIVFGWLAVILRDRGLAPVDAGLVLSLSVVAQAAAALVAPSFAIRSPDQRWWNVGAIALCLLGMLGCLYAPLAWAWIGAIMLGCAQGGLLALALMLLVLRAPNAHVAAHLSGMAQGVGYLLAAVGPLLAGLLHGWIGGWNAVALLFVGLGLAAAACGFGAGRARYVGVMLHHR